jgi:hypothetical protein
MPPIAPVAISDNSSEFGDGAIYRLFRTLSISTTTNTRTLVPHLDRSLAAALARAIPKEGASTVEIRRNRLARDSQTGVSLPAVSGGLRTFSAFTGGRKLVVLETFK